MMLGSEEFLQAIRLMPLFLMALVVLDDKRELLVGKRVYAPAKKWWFVPGGRVFKNETLHEAFS